MHKALTTLLGLVVLVSAVRDAQAGDVTALLRDVQLTSSEDGKVKIVFWIPDEYWEQSFKDDPNVPPASQKAVLDIVHDYLVFAVVEGEFAADGKFTGEPKEALAARLSVAVDEQQLQALADGDLSPAAQNLFRNLKPFLSQVAGKIGDSMEFMIFEGRDKQGKRYADPHEKGMLTAKLGPREFKWRLPLGSLLPPKYDVATGEQFPGNFDFSPYTGDKLSVDKPAEK